MGQPFKKAWLWTKLGVIVLVVVYVTLFFVFNRGHKADVWLFPWVAFRDVSLDWIVPVTAVAAILAFYIVRKITGVLHQLSEMREADKVRQRDKKMEDLARQVEKKLSSGEGGPPNRTV